jgi:hypothetical protein
MFVMYFPPFFEISEPERKSVSLRCYSGKSPRLAVGLRDRPSNVRDRALEARPCVGGVLYTLIIAKSDALCNRQNIQKYITFIVRFGASLLSLF